MLVACRLAGLSALETHLRASSRSHHRTRRQSLSPPNPDRSGADLLAQTGEDAGSPAANVSMAGHVRPLNRFFGWGQGLAADVETTVLGSTGRESRSPVGAQ